ncbi:MAG: ribonuclease R [Steroidobacteraceae bacterium]
MRRKNFSKRDRGSGAQGRQRPPRAPATGAVTTSNARVGQQVEGILSANRAGFGFVRVEGMAESVFLPPPQMKGLIHGDRVRVTLRHDPQGRWLGQFEALVERTLKAFLATVEAAGKDFWLRSADPKLGLYCQAIVAGPPLRNGDWVLAQLATAPEQGQGGTARVMRVLDPEKPVEMATETALARFELPVEFSAQALADAERWGGSVDPAEAARRVDLRELPLVTIDGKDARDFDDAVFAEPVTGGFRLVVAIADVSHYVRPGTALDDEARARGTSVYFPNRVIPMLPEALSNHLCSLEPQVDRLCMVADMEIASRGTLRNCKVYPAVMRSAARLTYDQAYAALFKGEPAARAPLGALVERLLPLVEVYRALLAARRKRGALDLDAPEAAFRINEAGQVEDVFFPSRNDAHRLIEECMVLANVAVAQVLSAQHQAALYRVHAAPDERKLEQLSSTLRVLGIEVPLPAPEELKTRDLASIATKVRDPGERAFVETLVVRSMAQALYQPENIGHFGLALTHYAHFTSPIRRYPDLMVHRSLRVTLGLADRHSVPEGEALAAAGVDLSRLEKRADESDRYVENFLKCVWLRDRVGQSFEALITTVVEFGCFVRILAAGIDGLLHLSALQDDDYQMSRDGGQWLGQRNKRRLAPGVAVRVTIMAVRPVEGMIDLALTE